MSQQQQQSSSSSAAAASSGLVYSREFMLSLFSRDLPVARGFFHWPAVVSESMIETPLSAVPFEITAEIQDDRPSGHHASGGGAGGGGRGGRGAAGAGAGAGALGAGAAGGRGRGRALASAAPAAAGRGAGRGAASLGGGRHDEHGGGGGGDDLPAWATDDAPALEEWQPDAAAAKFQAEFERERAMYHAERARAREDDHSDADSADAANDDTFGPSSSPPHAAAAAPAPAPAPAKAAPPPAGTGAARATATHAAAPVAGAAAHAAVAAAPAPAAVTAAPATASSAHAGGAAHHPESPPVQPHRSFGRGAGALSSPQGVLGHARFSSAGDPASSQQQPVAATAAAVTAAPTHAAPAPAAVAPAQPLQQTRPAEIQPSVQAQRQPQFEDAERGPGGVLEGPHVLAAQQALYGAEELALFQQQQQQQQRLQLLQQQVLQMGPPEFSWFYIDPHGQIQGPFPSHDMQAWYERDYFPANLLVRLEVWPTFVPLASMAAATGHADFITVATTALHQWRAQQLARLQAQAGFAPMGAAPGVFVQGALGSQPVQPIEAAALHPQHVQPQPQPQPVQQLQPAAAAAAAAAGCATAAAAAGSAAGGTPGLCAAAADSAGHWRQAR
jgi:hypothetical protein